MLRTAGLHHITAITADPQRNVDFYEGVLGQRFVKRTVNFDDPSAYHLYYGDYVGSPGTALTFFSWKGLPPGTRGPGEASGWSYRIPPGSVGFWRQRLDAHGVRTVETNRFGERTLSFTDPDGHQLRFAESVAIEAPSIRPWHDGPVPAEKVLQGFYSIELSVESIATIEPVLLEVFGYTKIGEEAGTVRYGVPSALGQYVDVVVARGSLARQGVGSIHHVAFRATDDAEREAFRTKLTELGVAVTGLVDRVFFHSSYFWTPARILFEIATDEPGFTVNEPAERLGEQLVLPAQYEVNRAQIEAYLDPIVLPRHHGT